MNLQYQDAIDACSSKPKFAFYKAYALYRLDKLDETLAVLDAAPRQDEESVRHLRAQILYRQGRYAECIPLYEAILKGLTEAGADAQDVWDAQLNLAACMVSAGRGSQLLEHPALADVVATVAAGNVLKDDLPYELVYNIACALVDDGKAGIAAKALEQSLAVGSRYLTEEERMSAGEVLAELAPVRAQAALMLQSAHYDDAATAIYSQIAGPAGKAGKHHGTGGDAATVSVVSNNVACMKSDVRGLIDGVKRITAAQAGAQTAKLTRRQILTLHHNKALLLLQLRKLDEASAALAELKTSLAAESSGGNDVAYLQQLTQHANAIEVSIQHQRAVLAEGHAAAAAATLANLSAAAAGISSSAPVSPLTAAYAQLLANEGRAGDAAEVISKASVAGSTAVAVTTAQLLRASGKGDEAAVAAISAAVSHWSAVVASHKGATDTIDAQHAVAMAFQAFRTRAGLLTGLRRYDQAASDYAAVLALPGLTSEQRAATLACLATLKMAQATAVGTSSTDAAAAKKRESLSAEADKLLKEASGMAGGASATAQQQLARRGSKTGLTAAAVDNLDLLEVTPPDQRSSAAGGAAVPQSPRKPAAAGAVEPPSPKLGASAAAGAAVSAEDAAKLKAAADAKKARAKRKRAKRRVAYLAKLQASGKYDLVGIPAPQPDRWLPRRERNKKHRKQVKGYVTGGGHQGGSDDKTERMLDARAKAEKEKASGKAGDAKGSKGGKEAPAPAPAASAAAAAGAKKKGGKKK